MIPIKTSHWFHGVTSQFSPLQAEAQFDAAVIGGGFAGLSSAIRLKELCPTKRVAILEAKHLGFGASGRSGGWVEAFPPLYWLADDLTNQSLAEKFGFSIRASQNFMLGLVNPDSDEILSTDWKISKHHLFARNYIERATLRWLKSRLDAVQMPCEYKEYSSNQSTLGYSTIAKLSWDCLFINPYKAIQILQARCKKLGIEIYENTPVKRIDHETNPIQIHLENGVKVLANKLILATNGYTSKIQLSEVRPTSFVRHTYMISTGPLEDKIIEKMSKGRQSFGDPVHSYYSGRFQGDRFLFSGSDLSSNATEADDRRISAYQKLIGECHRRFPFLADFQIESAWGGPTLMTPSDAPFINQSEKNPNLIYNIGFGGGSGICRAMQSGSLIAPLAFPELASNAEDLNRLRQIWTSSQFPMLGPFRVLNGVIKNLLFKKGITKI